MAHLPAAAVPDSAPFSVMQEQRLLFYVVRVPEELFEIFLDVARRHSDRFECTRITYQKQKSTLLIYYKSFWLPGGSHFVWYQHS